MDNQPSRATGISRRAVSQRESIAANRQWWDEEAVRYHVEHGQFLGDTDFVWCPEGLREAEARLLGEVEGRRVLEIGAGAAMCSRWLATRGAQVLAVDLSAGMLAQASVQNIRTGVRVPLVQADAGALPIASGSVDAAFASYGAVPFVADTATVMAEAARVLKPGGRWVFSTSHPLRWAFPDDPGADGLVAGAGGTSYFDRRPYVEVDADGAPVYAEHHRTFGDRVREITAAGLVLTAVVEPEWPTGHTRVWGGWSPTRGAVIPGTAIFCCRRPD